MAAPPMYRSQSYAPRPVSIINNCATPFVPPAPAPPKRTESVHSSLPSVNSGVSCGTSQERIILQGDMFSRSEHDVQKNNQMQFLDELEEEGRKCKEAAEVNEKIRERNSERSQREEEMPHPCRSDQLSKQTIATECIEPIDKHEQKQKKNKKLWSTCSGRG